MHLNTILQLQQQADAMRAENDSTIADLMRRLEAATTGGHQDLRNQSYPPTDTCEKPAEAMISPPRHLTARQPVDPLLREDGVQSCVSPEKVDVGQD